MSRALLIFVGSGQVDSYINVMANAVDRCDVGQIVLIKISNVPSGQQGKLEDFDERLRKAVVDLVEGKYEYRGQVLDIDVGIPEYQKLKQVFLSSRTIMSIDYLFLREEIAKLKNICN